MSLVFRSIGVSRLRIVTDGEGVTTLAAGYGCPLRCRYCLNPQCFEAPEPAKEYTVQQLIETVAVDDLYFLATGGGVMFGGGEPLLQADFIHAFRKEAPSGWKIGLESSLAVDPKELAKVIPDIDLFLVDIKDMDPGIYRAYTGCSNEKTLAGLRLLLEKTDPEKIRVRIPLIEGFNTEEDRRRSQEQLRQMGFSKFDLFRYDITRGRRKAGNPAEK